MQIDNHTITPPASIYPLVNEFSQARIPGRNVILMNPIMFGAGDRALADRIAVIAINQGCRVVIVPIETDGSMSYMLRPLKISSYDKEVNMASMDNPVFIVAPVGYFPVEELKKTSKNFVEITKLLRMMSF